MHVSKEVPTRHHCGKIPQTLSRKATCWAASVKCLYTNADRIGNKDEELEICVQLQAYNHVGITETAWDGSYDWHVATEG